MKNIVTEIFKEIRRSPLIVCSATRWLISVLLPEYNWGKMSFLKPRKEKAKAKEALSPEERKARIDKLVAHGFIFPDSGQHATEEEARELAEALVDGDERRFTSLFLHHELIVWPGQIWGAK